MIELWSARKVDPIAYAGFTTFKKYPAERTSGYDCELLKPERSNNLLSRSLLLKSL